MKKLQYGLLGLILLASNLSSAAADNAPVLGKAKDLQSAISACAGKKGGDSCSLTPASQDGHYSSMVVMSGACMLGKVDFEEEGIQASVLTCQPKKIQPADLQGKSKVIKADQADAPTHVVDDKQQTVTSSKYILPK